jgi:hypothetical protein
MLGEGYHAAYELDCGDIGHSAVYASPKGYHAAYELGCGGSGNSAVYAIP